MNAGEPGRKRSLVPGRGLEIVAQTVDSRGGAQDLEGNYPPKYPLDVVFNKPASYHLRRLPNYGFAKK